MFFWFYSLILVFSAAIFTLCGTALAQMLLRLAAVQDEPNARSNHATPVPRGGGVAIVFALLGFMLVAGAPSHLLWAALGLAAISFTDDIRGVTVRDRLIIQVAAVGIALTSLEGSVFQGLLPFWPDRLLAGLLLLGYLNLYNFMDGIDGIAGAQTVTLGLGFLALATVIPTHTLGLGIDGALLIATAGAFLWFNWHPAKIFMGDVGSVTLGLITGFILLQLAAEGYPAAALILPAYYLVDGGLTFFRRLWAREKVWEAHSQHAYQRAVRAGRPHDWVVIRIAVFNCLAIILAGLSLIGAEWAAVMTVLAYGGALVLWWSLKNQKPEAGNQKPQAVIEGEFEEIAAEPSLITQQ